MAISPDISVAMCTYNGAKYISEQITSIASQTLLPAEIVISDDASSDGTVALLKQTWDRLTIQNQELSKIRFIVLGNKSSLGVTANFEQAIAQTTKPIIFLSDQDDLWMSNRVEVQSACIRDGADFVFGDAQLIDAGGKFLGVRLFEALELKQSDISKISSDPVSVLIKRNIVTGATVAFRREIFEEATPFPLSWVHDEWLAMVAAFSKKMIIITEPLIEYRQHSSNQIGVEKSSMATRMAKLRENGANRNARLLDRINALAARTGDLGVGSNDLNRIFSAQKLQIARSGYPRNRFIRWVPVMGQVFSGRYFRVSNGARDVLRDLVQSVTG